MYLNILIVYISQRASWFAIVPMFVKQTANLYSTDTISFNDADFSNNLAGKHRCAIASICVLSCGWAS